jgi:hypothetical protein
VARRAALGRALSARARWMSSRFALRRSTSLVHPRSRLIAIDFSTACVASSQRPSPV